MTEQAEEPPVLEGVEMPSYEMELLDESKKGIDSPPSYSSERPHEERRMSFGVGPDQ